MTLEGTKINRIIFNYPCVVKLNKAGARVVDGRTFYGQIDQGLRHFTEARINLIGVDLPPTKTQEIRGPAREITQEDLDRFDRAKTCLAMALWSKDILTEVTPPPRNSVGRRIIVSTLRPNENNRTVARAYIQIARQNPLYSNLCHSVAGFSFMDVNSFVNFMGNWSWNLDKAVEILDSFELLDSSIG